MFTDFSDFLGRLQPSKTTIQRTPDTLGVEESSLLYSTLLYSTLLYSTLLYATLLYFTLPYFTLLYFTLLYPTLLYSTLLYFTLSRTSRTLYFLDSRELLEVLRDFLGSEVVQQRSCTAAKLHSSEVVQQ